MPLEGLIFDNFQGDYITLPEASDTAIHKLRDAIWPIYQPRYGGPEDAGFLRPENLVIGYEGASAAYAYPVKMMNFHEILNDVIDGVPVLITYCAIGSSAVVFDRRMGGEELVFGNTSALFENGLVMYDFRTGSYWLQTAGEAIVGSLTGERLEPLPSVVMPWQSWREMHPQTRVLSQDQGFAWIPEYENAALLFNFAEEIEDTWARFPATGVFEIRHPVTINKLDPRLPLSALAISVKAGAEEKVYPLEDLGNAVVNDAIGDEPVLVISQRGPVGTAFSRRLNGRVLSFELLDGQIRDLETDSRWDLGGRSLAGPLAGQELQPLPTRRAFWLFLSIAIPDIPLYQP